MKDIWNEIRIDDEGEVSLTPDQEEFVSQVVTSKILLKYHDEFRNELEKERRKMIRALEKSLTKR